MIIIAIVLAQLTILALYFLGMVLKLDKMDRYSNTKLACGVVITTLLIGVILIYGHRISNIYLGIAFGFVAWIVDYISNKKYKWIQYNKIKTTKIRAEMTLNNIDNIELENKIKEFIRQLDIYLHNYELLHDLNNNKELYESYKALNSELLLNKREIKDLSNDIKAVMFKSLDI